MQELKGNHRTAHWTALVCSLDRATRSLSKKNRVRKIEDLSRSRAKQKEEDIDREFVLKGGCWLVAINFDLRVAASKGGLSSFV